MHLQELQANVAKVWHRFAYSGYHPFDRDIAAMRNQGKQAWEENGQPEHASIPAPAWGDPTADDGFETLMQILYGKALEQEIHQ